MFFEIFKSEFVAITNEQGLSDYWSLMNDEEIKKASESKFVQIGSHGYFHNNLANVSIEEASNEMRLSKNYLENLVQKEVNEIAYPDGSYSSSVINEAETLGFKHQLALEYLFHEDKLDSRIEHRFGMYPVYSDINQIFSISNMLL